MQAQNLSVAELEGAAHKVLMIMQWPALLLCRRVPTSYAQVGRSRSVTGCFPCAVRRRR